MSDESAGFKSANASMDCEVFASVVRHELNARFHAGNDTDFSRIP